MQENFVSRWKSKAKELKSQIRVLYSARKDPRIPWYVKLLLVVIVAYALSPIDLIPDPIPILGYLDDLLILPLGIALVIKLIPEEVIKEYDQKARGSLSDKKPQNWIAGGIIILIWISIALWLIQLFL